MRFFPWEAYDPDVERWIRAVEAQDGQSLELGVRKAYAKLVDDLKVNSIWTPIQTMVVKMGARTLAGALIDIKNPSSSWTNHNFVSDDFNRTTGWIGDGSTKYLDSGRDNGADGQDDQAVWTFATELGTTNTRRMMGRGVSNNGSVNLVRDSGTILRTRCRNNSVDDFSGGHAVGLMGVSRSSSSQFVIRGGQSETTKSRSSQTPLSGNIYDYGTNNGSGGAEFSNYRSCAAAIGAAHSLSAAETCMDTFIASITALGL